LTTGQWGAMGIMAALKRREVGGCGEHVRPALIDTAFNLMNHQLLAYLATGQEPQRLGSGAPSAAPYGVFEASDGEIMIATASEPQFPRLCAALGLDNLVADSSYKDMACRIANRTTLDNLIRAQIRTNSVDYWLDTLAGRGISVGRVNGVAEACQLPVVKERDLFVHLPQSGEKCQLAQLRIPIDQDGIGIRSAPPKLGQHSIYLDVVDLNWPDISADQTVT